MRLFTKSNIATIAIVTGIVVASGTGGAVAGAMITGKQIKDGTVTTADIKNNNLTGTDIKTGSLGGTDIKNGSIGSADLAPSARGVTGIELVQEELEVETANTESNLAASCPEGKLIISATGYWENTSLAVQVVFQDNGASAYTTGSSEEADILKLQIICGAY